MKHFNLEDFAGGKLSAQINKALEKVTENVQDPNTDAEKVRKITVTIAFKPNAERNYVAMGKDIRTGQVECVEIMNQIPGQMSVDEVAEETKEEAEEPIQAFDPDTGEIYEPSNNVVDLRARQA